MSLTLSKEQRTNRNMKIKTQVTDKTPANTDEVIFLSTEDKLPKGIDSREFSGKEGSSCLIHGKIRQLYVGLGTKKKITKTTLRKATGLAVKKLTSIGLFLTRSFTHESLTIRKRLYAT